MLWAHQCQKNRLKSYSLVPRSPLLLRQGLGATEPIDVPTSFPLVNSNRVIVPSFDALVLTLCINGFDVHRVLVDPGSVAYLLQL